MQAIPFPLCKIHMSLYFHPSTKTTMVTILVTLPTVRVLADIPAASRVGGVQADGVSCGDIECWRCEGNLWSKFDLPRICLKLTFLWLLMFWVLGFVVCCCFPLFIS